MSLCVKTTISKTQNVVYPQVSSIPGKRTRMCRM